MSNTTIIKHLNNVLGKHKAKDIKTSDGGNVQEALDLAGLAVTGEILATAGQTVISGIAFDLPTSKNEFFVIFNNLIADLSLYERTGLNEITFNSPLLENDKIRICRGAINKALTDGYVATDPSGIVGGYQIPNIVGISQVDYNNILVKNPDVLYVIPE